MVRSISSTSGSNVRGGGIRCLNSRFRAKFRLKRRNDALGECPNLNAARVRGRHNRQSDPAPDKIQNGRDGRRPAQNAESDVAAASAPDGSELQIEFYGPEDGTPIVLTHGWGLDSREWNYLKRDLSDHFRLIVWDEPGLGKSTPPTNRDYSLENLARDLEAVLGLAGISRRSFSDIVSAG